MAGFSTSRLNGVMLILVSETGTRKNALSSLQMKSSLIVNWKRGKSWYHMTALRLLRRLIIVRA